MSSERHGTTVKAEPVAEQAFHRRTTWTALAITGVVAAFVVAAVMLTIASQALLLTFAAVLFACGVHGIAGWLSRKLHWRLGWCIALCAAVFVIAMSAIVLIGVPHVIEQADDLGQTATAAFETLKTTRFGKVVVGTANIKAITGGGSMERVLGVMGTVSGAVGAFAYVFFVTLYLAASPAPYVRGLVRLFPVPKRSQVEELLENLNVTMRRWLWSRLISMVAVAVSTWLGLWLLGVPLAKTLALIAGLLVFVPNIGPVLATGPALLVGYGVSPAHFFYVGTLYLAIAIADGYGLTPWVTQKAVDIPSGLVLMAQVVIGALWGALGIAFATPLFACLVIIVRRLYVENTLEAHAELHGGSH